MKTIPLEIAKTKTCPFKQQTNLLIDNFCTPETCIAWQYTEKYSFNKHFRGGALIEHTATRSTDSVTNEGYCNLIRNKDET